MSAHDTSVEQLLIEGDLDVEGRLWDSSNSAMRVECRSGDRHMRAVYKPRRGERPLWDFPTGTLGLREVATYAVDRALGWDLVPVTVWREEAPLGPGSLQVWIDGDPDDAPVDVVDARTLPEGWHVVAEGEGARGDHVCLVHEESAPLRRLALLDAVVNNADRKGGHVLRAGPDALAGIDHGLTFHEEPKLRTVLWGWAGTPIDAASLTDLAHLAEGWSQWSTCLEPLLTLSEIAATRDRLEMLVTEGTFPDPDGAWPALPWPAM
ncbi:MAG: hypothetical protein RL134_1814 [Actinomycetota bacterium]